MRALMRSRNETRPFFFCKGRAFLPLLSSLLLVTLSVRAQAQTGVLAPLGRLGIPSSEAAKVQRWVGAALASLPSYHWLATSRLNKPPRSESDCESRPSCLGSAARQVGAEVIVAGDIGSLGGAYMIYLRLVNASGKQIRSVNEVLDPNKPGLRDAARAVAYRLLLPEKYAGSIKVEVDVANAWVYLDGMRMAKSPADPLAGVTVGTHALRVTHEAYRDFVRFVTVGFEENVTVPVKLSAFPVRAEEMKLVEHVERTTLTDSELPWYRRWLAVTAFGAVVLAGASVTVAILSRRSVPRDSEVIVRP
jgi:hypothetical protein